MTIPRYEVLHAYWASRPPVHVVQAMRFIKQDRPQSSNTREEFDAAMQSVR